MSLTRERRFGGDVYGVRSSAAPRTGSDCPRDRPGALRGALRRAARSAIAPWTVTGRRRRGLTVGRRLRLIVRLVRPYPTAAPAVRDRARRRYFTSAWTRDSTEGWVANRSAKPSRGLSRHNSITAEVAPGSSPRPSILRSAEIMASGFLVSSTDPASASSSRERDSASRTSCDNSQASAISATATMMTRIGAAAGAFPVAVGRRRRGRR